MQSKTPDLQQPKNSDELVEAIGRIVRDHYEQSGRPVDGSFLAYLLRQKYPDLDYLKLGMSKLSDAVRIGVEREIVLKNTSVRHLELTPFRNEIPAPRAPGGSAAGTTGSPQYVRPDLWAAIVLSEPSQKTFMRKGSGELIHSPQKDQAEASAGDDLVAVEPISESTQLKWLKEYLNSSNAAPGIDTNQPKAIEKLLRGGIRDFGRGVELGWKIFRSRKVVDQVKRWAVAHGIADAMVLTTRDVRAKPKSQSDHVGEARDPARDRFRRAVLAAVEDLTPEELDGLRLPVRSIRRHFAPR